MFKRIFSKDTFKTICMHIHETNYRWDDMEPVYRPALIWALLAISVGVFGKLLTLLFGLLLVAQRILYHEAVWQTWMRVTIEADSCCCDDDTCSINQGE